MIQKVSNQYKNDLLANGHSEFNSGNTSCFDKLRSTSPGRNLIWEGKHLPENLETNKYPYAAKMASARMHDRARLRSGAYVQVTEVTSEKGRAADATAVGRVQAQSNRCAEEAATL